MNVVKVYEDEAQKLVLSQMVRLIGDVRISAIRSNKGPFRKREPIAVFHPRTTQELLAQIAAELDALIADHSHMRDFAAVMQGLLWRLPTVNPVAAYNELLNTREQWLDDLTDARTEERIYDADLTAVRVDEVSRMIERIRQERRKPTRRELTAIHLAHEAMARGARLSLPYKSLPRPGQGETQTHMSITDPGEGHLQGTSTDAAFLRGVLVHVEHLERGHKDREAIEPYRIPSVLDVAKVRLHVGASAPVTSFIGRPLFDSGSFQLDLWKTVQTMAAAATAMFQQGVAECKFAMERMTSSQIIDFMRGIRGNVLRDARTQVLSAAFNLNTPLIDDRGGEARRITDRREIGLLGIELVKSGGFDKVTWDGSTDTYPSVPIVEQISHATALELVHRAHEKGLLTYFSAGFRFGHIPAAVYTGVDGVGIGGAQILRYMDSETGYHGPFQPENISQILAVRDEAARSPLGRAAAALARLDWMSHEGRLNDRLEQLRAELYEALSRKQVDGILQSPELQALV